MAAFQFTDTKVALDIAGHKFEVRATARFMERIGACGRTLAEFSQKAKGQIGLDDAERLLRGQIDALLGDGACETIFEGREADYYDSLEVWQYVVETAQAAQARRPALAALAKSAK